MILDFFDIAASEDEICKRSNWTFEKGTTNAGLMRALESYGLESRIIDKADLKDLERWFKKGIPVIVDWFTGGVKPTPSDMPNGHSSVVVGIDEKQINLLDPEDGKIRNINRKDFERVWFDFVSPTINPESLRMRQMIVSKQK